jgi:hypothetical protein
METLIKVERKLIKITNGDINKKLLIEPLIKFKKFVNVTINNFLLTFINDSISNFLLISY